MIDFAHLRSAYKADWDEAQLHSNISRELNALLDIYYRNVKLYKEIEIRINVPAWFVFPIHYRESNCDFHTHLHNGDPLAHRTVHVPAGRPEYGEPPFKWVDSAIDALRLEGLHRWKDWSVEGCLWKWECYNGLGYLEKGRHSPYLWSGTTLYSTGKYASDGVFDIYLKDEQLGCAAILKSFVQKKELTIKE